MTAPPTLRDAGKVYVEVGLNEVASKDRNPNVPYGCEEVATDAIACARAGASVIHFHARHSDGSQAWTDDGVYRRAMELIADEVELVTYPTYPPRVPREERYRHLWALADEPSSAPLEFAPIDIGSRNVSLWEPDAERFAPLDILPADSQVAVNPPDEIEWVIEQSAQRDLHPTLGIFDMTYLRYSIHALWAGLLQPPLMLKWFLSERWIGGTFPTPAGLDAYLSQVPDDVDHEGLVVPYAMLQVDEIEGLWRHGLDRRQNIRVGIGDNPEAFPAATNAELVGRVVDLIRHGGLEPATADDVRHRFGLRGAVAGSPR